MHYRTATREPVRLTRLGKPFSDVFDGRQGNVARYPRRVRILAATLFLCAFSFRTAIILSRGLHPTLGLTETVNVAVSLLHTGHFADAFGPGSGPTAHKAPAYPIMLSVVFRFLGTGSAGEVAKRLFAALIASLTYALLPFVVTELGLPFEVAICSGAVAAFAPLNFWPESLGDHESVLTALMVALLFLHVARIWRSGQFSTKSAAWLGGVAGVGSLVSPAIMLLFAVWILLGFWLFRNVWLTYLRGVALSCVLVVLCLTPWIMRNYLTFGVPIWSRADFWMEVNISNNDVANPVMDRNGAAFLLMHPFCSPSARAKYTAEGEVAFQGEEEKEARTWLRRHPRQFAVLSAARLVYFWFPPMINPLIRLGMATLTLMAGCGLIILLRTQHSATNWLVVSLFVVYPPIYYFVQASSRYRYPIEWAIKLLAGLAVWAAVRPVWERILPRESPAIESVST